MSEPRWLIIARSHVGVREIPGPRHEPIIQRWLRQLRGWWTDDETPWCGTFVAACLVDANLRIPELWMRAREYLNWGRALSEPALGCVVVFERGPGGHVGFVVGQDGRGRIMVLGGNQGNAVSVAPFDRSRVLGYRWPLNIAPPQSLAPLPILDANGVPSSRHEA